MPYKALPKGTKTRPATMIIIKIITNKTQRGTLTKEKKLTPTKVQQEGRER